MSRLFKLGAVAGLVIVGVIAGVHWGQAPVAQTATPGSPTGGLVLAAPAFAQAAARTFLDDEAGISAYLKLDQAVDLAKVRGLYRVIEDETDTYVIGTIPLSRYGTDWWPHVWITKDGWVIAYYRKAEPTSRLMHWGFYADGRITSTTLREIVLAVGKALGIATTAIDAGLRYYHWQHPAATRLFVIVGSGTFKYTIPEAIQVAEASWSLQGNISWSGYGYGWSRLTVDDEKIGEYGEGNYTVVQFLARKYLSAQSHTVQATAHRGSVTCGIFLVYR